MRLIYYWLLTFLGIGATGAILPRLDAATPTEAYQR